MKTVRAANGFTLVELMVVIAIVGILAGVLVVAVMGAFGKSDEYETQTAIHTLRASIESFETNNHFSPPGSIAQLCQYIGAPVIENDPNEFNKGIEALVMALRRRENGGPFMTAEFFNKHFSNTDDDELSSDIANTGAAPKLFEIRDAWDNPLVYVCLREFDMPGAQLPIMVRKADGNIEEIDPVEMKAKLTHPETGEKLAKSWAIWSFGPDGLNDYGRGDDIVSWEPKLTVAD